MDRSAFDSLAHLVENANPYDPGESEAIVDQIYSLRDQVAPQGDSTGALDAAATLIRHRATTQGEHPEELIELVGRLIENAATAYCGQMRHEPLVLKGPSRREPIPSELGDTRLRLVSDLHLGEVLVHAGHVTPQQLDQALEFQKVTGERIGEALVNLGATTWQCIEDALNVQRRSRGKRPPVAG